MKFIVTYRNEFESTIEAKDANEAIEKFERGECKIERCDKGELWKEYIDVYTEDGEQVRTKHYYC